MLHRSPDNNQCGREWLQRVIQLKSNRIPSHFLHWKSLWCCGCYLNLGRSFASTISSTPTLCHCNVKRNQNKCDDYLHLGKARLTSILPDAGSTIGWNTGNSNTKSWNKPGTGSTSRFFLALFHWNLLILPLSAGVFFHGTMPTPVKKIRNMHA